MKRYGLLLLAFSLSACANAIETRQENAEAIAAAGHLTPAVIDSGLFNLSSWQKFADGGAAHVYIEGDGFAWVSRTEKSRNPTPKNPVALKLAAADPWPNVVYLARPCQYSSWNGGGACPDKYWTDARTAPQVIEAYQKALDRLKADHHIPAFHLIGYSGGAAVAAIVAADRTDVATLRTVAGNIDYQAFYDLHHVSVLAQSVAPESIAAKIAHIPQRHFIGGDDKVVPPQVFEAWQAASRNVDCLSSRIVPGNTHGDGWDAAWPQLLAEPVVCKLQ